jgi:hypothetical protein
MMSRWLMLTLGAWALMGCYDDSPCDAGQELRDGACQAIEEDSPSPGGSSGAGGGASGASGAGGTAGGSAATEFGDPCGDHSECGDPVPYCALQPGQTVGYCTVTDCLPPEDTDVCPDGWGCLDLSIFAPGEPAICTEP